MRNVMTRGDRAEVCYTRENNAAARIWVVPVPTRLRCLVGASEGRREGMLGSLCCCLVLLLGSLCRRLALEHPRCLGDQRAIVAVRSLPINIAGPSYAMA